jgi:hypothetical protein
LNFKRWEHAKVTQKRKFANKKAPREDPQEALLFNFGAQ